MKKSLLIFFVILFTSCLSQSTLNENCKVFISYSIDNQENAEFIEFKIKNTSQFNIEIPKSLNEVFLSILSLEVYNENLKDYDKVNYKVREYDFLGMYKGKKILLRPNSTARYKFCISNIKDLKKITSKNKLYRLKIDLNLSEFINCYLFTDWIYFEIK